VYGIVESPINETCCHETFIMNKLYISSSIFFVLGILIPISTSYFKVSFIRNSENNAKRIFQENIDLAKQHDRVFVYPEFFPCFISVEFKQDLIKMLCNQEGIKSFYCRGSSPFAVDESMMLIVSSMNDLEEVNFKGCRLVGKPFKSLKNAPKLSTVIIERCVFEEEGWESFVSLNNLRILALLSLLEEHDQYPYNMRQPISTESQQLIVDTLKKMTRLQGLVLDHTFGDYEKELSDSLPHTVIFIDHQDPDIHGHTSAYSKIEEIQAEITTE